MKSQLTFAICFGLLLLGSQVICEDPEVKEENDVIVLNEANFDKVVNSKEFILVEFFAPWCGHCQRFAPEFAKAAGLLKKNDPPVPLGKVDATVELNLAKRFGIRGYPTIAFFVKGSPIEYNPVSYTHLTLPTIYSV
eukprot:TRINITY_DN5652_c0_g1_i2.p1 TRINITY_DN5652_c0_g1~~TRINITY_DN5652_c0_g1_i2.p1  ORF type:complete len:137 (+),score=44.05 TRINITY_DN5652_c0_g1_i2:105-515(+)